MFRSTFVAAAVFATGAAAQSPSLELNGQTWRIAAQEAEVTSYRGRDAIALSRGRLWADDAQFSDGVISFDAALAQETVFVGAGWRAEKDGHFEEMYFRGHLNNKPDALQYTPVENGNSAWQIFSDANAIAPVSQNYEGWNRVKIVVEGDKADIYINSDTPSLHVPDLKTNLASGAVSLRASGREAGPVYFSNIVMRPLEDGEGVVGEAKPSPDLPDGLIEQWRVSTPFPETDVAQTLKLDKNAARGLDWLTLDVETNGIANLSKLAERDPSGANTVFIRTTIKSDEKQMKELRFGYSDRVRFYLNGKRIYHGDAGWRVRDYRFLGTVGFFDSVGLDLKKGENELLVAVSETFGGWAFAGAMADQSGVTLE